MSQELQLGKYEFFPYDEEIQRLLDELLLTDEEREKHPEDISTNCLNERNAPVSEIFSREKANNLTEAIAQARSYMGRNAEITMLLH